jgi:hypothetical protein
VCNVPAIKCPPVDVVEDAAKIKVGVAKKQIRLPLMEKVRGKLQILAPGPFDRDDIVWEK